MSEYVIGIDSVGLGSIAGPCTAAAVVFPRDFVFAEVIDSKALKPHQRFNAAQRIHAQSLHWALAASTATQIDRHGIAMCDRSCMVACALRCLARFPDAVIIIDGENKLPHPIPVGIQSAIPKADATVQAVGAASILAKVWRDSYMFSVAAAYPAYGFERHVGYGTITHRSQLKRFGPCPEHRRSYRTVKKVIQDGKI